MIGVGGYVSRDAADFHVHELPKHAPTGEGEHTLALILKEERTTQEAIRALADASGISERDIGYAGQKDKHALTTQWISAHLAPHQLRSEDSQVVVLAAHQHGQKLKLGQNLGNLFTIRISDMGAPEALEAGLTRVARGVPNYFERQRFGWVRYETRPEDDYEPPRDERGMPLQDPNNLAEDNVDRALDLLSRASRSGRAVGRGKRKREEKLLLSSLQSALFNLWVGERIRDGLMSRVLLGDVCRKRSGGTFYSTEPETDTARLLSGEIEVLGPMIGPRLFAARDEALAREEELFNRWGLSEELRAQLGRAWRGDRRPALLRPWGLSAHLERTADATHARLSFCLPSGSFATALLGDLINPERGTFERADRESRLRE